MQFFLILSLILSLSLVGYVYYRNNRPEETLSFPKAQQKEKIIFSAKRRRQKRNDRTREFYYPPLFPSEPLSGQTNEPWTPSFPAQQAIDFSPFIFRKPEEEEASVRIVFIPIKEKTEFPQTKEIETKDVGTNTEEILTPPKKVEIKIQTQDVGLEYIPEIKQESLPELDSFYFSSKEQRDFMRSLSHLPDIHEEAIEDHKEIDSILIRSRKQSLQNPLDQYGETIVSEYIPLSQKNLSSLILVFPDIEIKEADKDPFFKAIIKEESSEKTFIAKISQSNLKKYIGDESYEIVEKSLRNFHILSHNQTIREADSVEEYSPVLPRQQRRRSESRSFDYIENEPSRERNPILSFGEIPFDESEEEKHPF